MLISKQSRVPLTHVKNRPVTEPTQVVEVQQTKVEISKNELIRILNDIDLTDGSRITNLKIPEGADFEIRNGVITIEWEGT
jgi:hypothetical protein